MVKKIEDNETLKELEDMGEQEKVADKTFQKYNDEMKNITKLATSEANSIKVVEITAKDHKNISLWTKAGKRIGPMHRENCIVTFKRFWDNGIVLSTKQPTVEEVEAYKLTKEYKQIMADLAKSRKAKLKRSKKTSMEEMAKVIAQELGKSVTEITGILQQHEVKGKK